MPRFAQLNQEGLDFLERWEGKVPYVYDDFVYPTVRYKPGTAVKGTLTAGVGHTNPADIKEWIGKTIPESVIEKWLDQDLDAAEMDVHNLVKVRISERQRTALTSLRFNIGSAAFKRSTLLKKLLKGDFAGAAAEFPRWNKSKGKVIDGLVKRRAAEMELFTSDMQNKRSTNSQAKPDNSGWFTPEAIGTIGTGASGIGAVASGDGPVQYALAIIAVIAAIAVIGFFIYHRIKK